MTPVVRACALGLAACLSVPGLGGAHAYADSNVQVDTTVLDELGPPRNGDTGGPIVLTPPHRETGAAETKSTETGLAKTKPSGAATEAKTTTAEKPSAKAAAARPAETQKATPPSEPATKVATTSPAEVKAGTGGSRIVFAKGSADLPKTAEGVLAPLVKTLAADPAALLSVEAYAARGETGDETARRLALSRGLAVRRYLESHGIAGTRALIDARRAEAGGGPADRVDLAIAKN